MVEARLRLALVVTAATLIAEVTGGYLANSLALMSDAGHVSTDLFALVLAWIGVRQVRRPPTQRMTYGYHRLGVLIAIANALMLVAITAVILYEAASRLQAPPEVRGDLMLWVALAGLGANLFTLWLLRGAHSHNLNLRSAVLHVVGDILGSVGAVVGGGVLLFTGWNWVDPAVSLLIAVILTVGAWRIIRDAVRIFLDATPVHIDIAEVIAAMYQVTGVRKVHDLHVWAIAPKLHALSCHVELEDMRISQASAVLTEINYVLGGRFDIGHATIQVECAGCELDGLYCTLTPGDGDDDGHGRHDGLAVGPHIRRAG